MIKIKAKLKLYSGLNMRKQPFHNGYRPLFNFISTMKKSGQINLIDRDIFYPGDEGIVEILFVNKDYLGDNLNIGIEFTFGEGTEILGEGQILEIE